MSGHMTYRWRKVIHIFFLIQRTGKKKVLLSIPITIFKLKWHFCHVVKSTLIGKRTEVLLLKQLNLGSHLT